MIGMKIDEFCEKIYYGSEVEFVYNQVTYFVQGSSENGKHSLTIDFWRKTDGTEPPHEFLLDVICSTKEERLKKFEEAKIFEGKTFYQIVDEIEVIFG